LDQKEFLQVLKSCLKDLPEKLSQVFSLREMDEFDTEEICKELDITPTNLWVMLHRARALLRKCIDRNWFESPITETEQ